MRMKKRGRTNKGWVWTTRLYAETCYHNFLSFFFFKGTKSLGNTDSRKFIFADKASEKKIQQDPLFHPKLCVLGFLAETNHFTLVS